MTSIGTGYDLSNSVFSPDGRNFQVEYATKAVENGGTSIGLRCKDGVVLAVEKLIQSKLLVPGSNKRIATVDRHVGIAASGLIPDARHFTSRARNEASSWRKQYHGAIPVSSLADRMGQYTQAYTLYSSVRPFGVTCIIGGVDEEAGPSLWMVEPSGVGWGYFGAATGRGRQAAKAELEKLDLPNLTVEEGVKHAARIIHIAHGDNAGKDKDFELEMTWVRVDKANVVEVTESGVVKGHGRHEEVPKELVEEAEREAKKALEVEDEEDEKMEES
ncbi:nucleophile aminohydrolase [Sphaerosporella brunnea]|uniref:Proteasome subunit alpha type n=1 Tax=Sphaerosporella brunnea TaxID=1250544 RepID=A0A5J5EM97_9PEZI|nr:nucleophile aminohydrolase [Sphaerosporella brunnea]